MKVWSFVDTRAVSPVAYVNGTVFHTRYTLTFAVNGSPIVFHVLPGCLHAFILGWDIFDTLEMIITSRGATFPVRPTIHAFTFPLPLAIDGYYHIPFTSSSPSSITSLHRVHRVLSLVPFSTAHRIERLINENRDLIPKLPHTLNSPPSPSTPATPAPLRSSDPATAQQTKNLLTPRLQRC